MSQLRIDKRHGISKPVSAEEIEAYRKHAQERREANVVNAREILKRNGIYWVEFSRYPSMEDQGTYFVVHHQSFAVRYFPMTGLWITPEQFSRQRYGCRNLVRYLKGEVK